MNNKTNNKTSKPSDDDELISRTQLKNEAKALHRFGKELIELSKEKIMLLPLEESTKDAINDFHKQIGNIAKKRHIAYIAKCLRADDVTETKTILAEDSFSQLRKIKAQQEQNNKPTQQQLNTENKNNLIDLLLTHGDQQIQLLMDKYPQLNRQTLRQLMRNTQKAKTEIKIKQAKTKLAAFIAENKLKLD